MLLDLMLDCNDLEAQATFWSAALGYEAKRFADDPDVLLRDPEDETRPALWLQQVPEAKRGKNRLHLDLYVDDAEAEAERLVALGATQVEHVVNDKGSRWIVLTDPEGNELCACQGPPTR